MKRNLNRSFLTTLAILSLGLASGTLYAANHMLNAGELDWSQTSSWHDGVVPDVSTDAAVRAYIDGNYGGAAARTAIVQSTVPDQYLVIAQNSGQIKVTNNGFLNAFGNTVLYSGGGILIEGTGIYNANQRFYVGTGSALGATTVSLTGGELNTSNVMLVGDGANMEGSINVSGGIWTIDGIDTLRLANTASTAKGTITLSGTGKILNSRFAHSTEPNVPNNRLTIGYNGEGTFTQTGGEYEATGTGNGLRLSEVAGSSGTYSISGGALDLSAGASVTAGAGTARFEVTGAWDVAGVTNEIDIGGNLTLNTADSTLAFNLSAAGIELIMVGGNADLSNATLVIALADGYDGADLRALAVGGTFTTFDLLHTDGTINITGLSLVDNLPWGLRIGDWGVSTTNSQTLWVTVIPEPASAALLLLGGLALMRRRMR